MSLPTGPDKLPTRTRRTVLSSLVGGITGLAAGCLGTTDSSSGAAAPTATETPTDVATGTDTPESVDSVTKSPKLDSVLVEVARAEDPRAAAESRGLQTSDGRVLVVVELHPGRDLPSDPAVTVTSRSDTSVFAYVAYDDLRALAAHENVSAVRPPNQLS